MSELRLVVVVMFPSLQQGVVKSGGQESQWNGNDERHQVVAFQDSPPTLLVATGPDPFHPGSPAGTGSGGEPEL